MTLEEHNARKARTYKMLLLFGMMSILMIFAGLTSAYVVSKSTPDWLNEFQLPNAFIWSTLVMLASSVTFILALKVTKKGEITVEAKKDIGCLPGDTITVGTQNLIVKKVYINNSRAEVTCVNEESDLKVSLQTKKKLKKTLGEDNEQI